MKAPKDQSRVVEAAGVAAASSTLGPAIEAAMAGAVAAVSKDSEAVWARTDLSLEEKNKQIAALNEPAAVRKRMHEAREAVKAEHRAAQAPVEETAE